MKNIRRVGVFMGLLLSGAGAFAQAITPAAPKIGSPPPPLQLSQIFQGPQLDEVNWAKLKGNVVVLEFWNTACAPCIKAIPHLNELVESFRGKPVIFLSISDDNPDRLKQFLERRPMKSWLALDAPFTPTKTAFGIYGIPTTYIVDATGKIVAITHPAKLEARHLEAILAGQPSGLPVIEPDVEGPAESATAPDPGSNAPPRAVTVSIQGPLPFPTEGGYDSVGWNADHTVFQAEVAIMRDVLAAFFGVGREQVVSSVKLPEGLYNLTASAPPDQWPELQQRFITLVKTNLGLTVQLTQGDRDVYRMTLLSTNRPGLKRADQARGGGSFTGGFRLQHDSMDQIADWLTVPLGRPVLNETGQDGLWDVELKWHMAETELLLLQLDRKVRVLCVSNPKAILAGDLPAELRDKISDHDFKLLQTELAKPEDQQFLPNPTNVIQAAEAQLGLQLKPARRSLPVVEVRPAN